MSRLFTSYQMKEHKINNRVVLPPMVCFGWGNSEGYVSEMHIQHYERIAKAGTGIVIIEATCIDKDGRLSPDQLGIWDDKHIEGLKRLAGACKKHGAMTLIQIHHAGLKTPKSVIEISVSSSDYKEQDKIARELSETEIRDMQQKYVQAAIRAQEAGFDGIELHGAHGYLISQFMSPIINKRTDAYGGCIQNRMKFALEIVQQVKAAVNESFIIGYRMGGNEPTLENGIIIAKALEHAGVDILHVSAGIPSEELPTPPADFPYNWIVFCGTEIKKHLSIPVIAVNDIKTPERAVALLEKYKIDFAAIGKDHLSDPYWTKHAKENQEINKCLKCARCLWYSDGRKCPALKNIEEQTL